MEGQALDDAELIGRARRGDVGAYEELVRRYQDVALRTAYLVAPDGDADDACQEAFVKAWAALPRFRLDAPFRPWLLRIVTNEARNRRRSASRRHGLALRATEASGGRDIETSPEAAAIADEERHTLLAAVQVLRNEDREILAARYFLQLSEAEAAEILGIRRGTVKSRLSRAIGRLRAELQRAGSEGIDRD